MTTTVGWVHTGDSISNGLGSYPYQAYSWTDVGDETQPQSCWQATYYATNLIARPMGIAGTHLNSGGTYDLVPLCPTWVDPIIPVGYSVPPFDVARKWIFSTAIGSNDGAIEGYANPVDYAAAVASCCGLRRSAGFNYLIITTLLPRNDGHMTELNRGTYNTTVKDATWRAAHGIDAVMDFTTQPIMNDFATCSDPTYYGGGVHPTFLGFTLLAPIAKATIDAAVAALQ